MFPFWELASLRFVQIRARHTLQQLWERYPAAEIPLRTWYAIVQKTVWSEPSDVKRQLGSAVDFVADNRAIFDIGGNKFRIISLIDYTRQTVLITHVLDHKEYAKGNWKNDI